MDQTSVHDALEQVREVRRRVLERQRFLGYSAGGRLAGGALTIVAAAVMSHPVFPAGAWAMAAAWTATALLAAAINFGLCLRWYRTLPDDLRHLGRLYPLLDIMPPLLLAIGATAALVLHGQFDLLFGVWTGLFGLVNFYSGHHLPSSIRALGMFYLCCGLLFLLHPGVTIMNPWPMALVYGTGEAVGSWIVHRNAQAGRLWPVMPTRGAGSET